MVGKRCAALVVSISVALSGCATSSKDIAANYVSPNQYAGYDCQQIAAEAARIQTRVVQLGGRLDQAAQNDAGIMAVGLLLFWPVLFALGGTKQQEAEYARLKGEYDALEQAAVVRKCSPIATPTQAATASPSIPVSPRDIVPSGSEPAVPVQPALLTTTTAPPAARAIAATASQVESKYAFAAERFAKDTGCSSAAATLSVKAATYETFTVACSSGDPRVVRCDDGACAESSSEGNGSK